MGAGKVRTASDGLQTEYLSVTITGQTEIIITETVQHQVL